MSSMMLERTEPDYTELSAHTAFSFLHGASPPQDMVLTALLLGHVGIGIADRNTVAGVVRAWGTLKDIRNKDVLIESRRYGSGPGEIERIEKKVEADLEALSERAMGFKLITGARLVFADGTPDIIAYPETRQGWGNLCRLLTRGNLRAQKGSCTLFFEDLLTHLNDLLLIFVPPERPEDAAPILARLASASPGAVWLGASCLYRGRDRRRLARLAAVARGARVPLVALNEALYHRTEERDLHDVITCIREGVTIETAGLHLLSNGERHLKTSHEMARLFRDHPEAIAETGRVLARIDFSLEQLRYDYPEEPVPPGRTPQGWLEELTWRRASLRYPDGVPKRVERQIETELRLIEKLDYAPYFLTIYDIVQFAEGRGILCQGRGSAANSAVCYALGITAVDPATSDLLFARFLSEKRGEPPDIDVDFEHERREEVIQYLYDRYGRHRAGIAATVIHYRPKSAIREVGKALGLSEDVTARIGGMVWGSWSRDGLADDRVRQAGLDPENPTIRRAVDFAGRLLNAPRHLSQHVGGFILARHRLDEIVPVHNGAMPERTFIEWDKDDIDKLGIMKVDVLALGMLTCIAKAFDLVALHEGERLEMATIPWKDKETYDMLCRGESIGVFQVESRAQINMLPHLRPQEFYDLVIQVAIVRPGPIQGDMVHPYLRRRAGDEDVDFPSPAPPHDPDELRKVLGRTLGVPLFQEQAMQIAMVAAEFTDVEANQLRRAMATFRASGTIGLFETKMVERMVNRGYEREFAQRCYNQIKGFGEYGFPESHAASFAKLVYVSAWLKCHHPAVFACALLNSQPMGFYAPAQIVSDARSSGVEVRPCDLNFSVWDNTLERAEDGRLALRIGFRQIEGFQKTVAETIVERRGGGYETPEDVWRLARTPQRYLKLLADADAMRSLGLDRRAALWAVRRLPDDAPLPLFAAAEARELAEEAPLALPPMPLAEHVVADYQTLRLSLKAHPMAFLREQFTRERVTPCARLADCPDGAWVKAAGVVLVRQRPGKGNAIFITIEDETGIANALVWARDFERMRLAVMASRLALISGRIQKSPQGVVHLMARMVEDRTGDLDALSRTHLLEPERGPGDETDTPRRERSPSHPRAVRILPPSRDFH